ncbi:MAG: hypothetical protein N4S07_06370, partial [Lactobacillus iners]|nr:hypothetical protein [Lactobacillus iners]
IVKVFASILFFDIGSFYLTIKIYIASIIAAITNNKLANKKILKKFFLFCSAHSGPFQQRLAIINIAGISKIP